MLSERRKKMLLIIALGCVGFLVADRMIASPLLNLWRTNKQRISELRQDIEKGANLLALEEKLDTKWKEMLSNSLPRQTSITENQMLNAISNWAQSSSLSVTSLKPRWLPNEDDCRKLEVRLSGSGNLSSITKFLYTLETDQQAQKIEEMELASRDEKGQQLNLDLRFTGLVIGENKQ